MKIGSTTISLAGWVVNPLQPERGRAVRQAAIRQLVEDYGLSAVELTLDLALLYPQVFEAGFYTWLADLQQERGFAVSVHLPFIWLDFCSLNGPVRQASVESALRAVRLVRPLQVEAYVLHLWGGTTALISGVLGNPAQRAEFLGLLAAQGRRSLEDLSAAIPPAQLGVETLENLPFEEMWGHFKDLGTGICLDAGHLQCQGQPGVDFLERHAGRVCAVHLHDAQLHMQAGRQVCRDHLPLGRGQVDYIGFLNRLQAAGYSGTVILENNSQADLEESLAKLQAFL